MTSVAGVLPDHDNHHNAAVCPYCTHNGTFVMVHRDDLETALDCAVTGGRLDPGDPVYRRLRGYMKESS